MQFCCKASIVWNRRMISQWCVHLEYLHHNIDNYKKNIIGELDSFLRLQDCFDCNPNKKI